MLTFKITISIYDSKSQKFVLTFPLGAISECLTLENYCSRICMSNNILYQQTLKFVHWYKQHQYIKILINILAFICICSWTLFSVFMWWCLLDCLKINLMRFKNVVSKMFNFYYKLWYLLWKGCDCELAMAWHTFHRS